MSQSQFLQTAIDYQYGALLCLPNNKKNKTGKGRNKKDKESKETDKESKETDKGFIGSMINNIARMLNGTDSDGSIDVYKNPVAVIKKTHCQQKSRNRVSILSKTLSKKRSGHFCQEQQEGIVVVVDNTIIDDDYNRCSHRRQHHYCDSSNDLNSLNCVHSKLVESDLLLELTFKVFGELK